MSKGQLDFFSEFGPRQILDRWQIAFDNLFGLELTSINVFAKCYQNITTVQELGPVSFLLEF